MDDLDVDKTKASHDDSMGEAVTRSGDGSGHADFQPGFVFAGRYEILSAGQRGGMGIVYKCRDMKLHRVKALKLIYPHLLKSPQAIERFHQEVAISQELQHEHIVRVYDLGECEGQDFFTMEWVGGKSLRDLILVHKEWKQPFNIHDSYRIISQLCDALQYAHCYTIHRDIKPENILITGDGDALKIKLTDFGIAKMLTTSQFTATSLQMGTPYYMAPEQKLDAAQVNKRADIYSVGVVLFELLTLENTIGLEMPTEINIELPAEIDKVVKHALAMRPEKRYAEAGEIAAAFSDVVQTEKRRQEQIQEGKKTRAEREVELARRQREKEEAEAQRRKEARERQETEEQKRLETERRRKDEEERKRKEESVRLEEERKQREAAEEENRKRELEAEEQRRHQEEKRQNRRNVLIGIGLVLLALVVGGGFVLQSVEKARQSYQVALGEQARGGSEAGTKQIGVAAKAKQEVAAEKARRDGEKGITNNLGMTFVLIPAGTFVMGSLPDEPGRSNNETPHGVTITKPFYLQTTEVTQGQWKRVMGSNSSQFSNCGDDCPVDNVSWEDVREFLHRLNLHEGIDKYRLPTEAEWEYAARAGTETPFNTGTCLSTDQANFNGNAPLSDCAKGQYRRKTIRVGSFAPNAWGLYDIHGNVWEWVQDWYGNYPSGKVSDPMGPSTGSARVHRGGSWSSHAGYCRSAFRGVDVPDYRSRLLGFRLTRTQ